LQENQINDDTVLSKIAPKQYSLELAKGRCAMKLGKKRWR